MTVTDSIALIKREGSELAPPIPVEGKPEMQFKSSIHDVGASRVEIAACVTDCPSDLLEFWTESRSAILFEDSEYGQWGLEILDPQNALALTTSFHKQRTKDAMSGDIIFGKFVGDSDLLLIRCDKNADDFGCIIVALPLDKRNEWYSVSASLANFLENYIKAGGDKFWT